MAKATSAKKSKSGKKGAAVKFLGTRQSTITRDEIYHRLEWYFDRAHNPNGVHMISPGAPISALLRNLTLANLYENINRISPIFTPAWNSALFHGVRIPWVSQPPTAIGIQDVRSFGDLINSVVLSYQHFGWRVI